MEFRFEPRSATELASLFTPFAQKKREERKEVDSFCPPDLCTKSLCWAACSSSMSLVDISMLK